MNKDPIVIRKYENRRLYDTSTSRYINLEDVAAFIRDGKDVQVVDARTGEDLTRVVLTQIIMEDAKDGGAGLPLELLKQLIVTSDQARHEFLMWYLRNAFQMYQQAQESFQHHLAQATSAVVNPLETMRAWFGGQPPAAPPPPESAQEVAELRKRLEELEQRLAGKTARKPAPRKRSRRQG